MMNNMRPFSRDHHSCTDRRQVFQTYPPRNAPSLLDVRDALEATSSLRITDRHEYFQSVGIDYGRVCEYHDEVCKLERCYLMTQTTSMIQMTPIIQECREHIRFAQVAIAFMWHVMMVDE